MVKFNARTTAPYEGIQNHILDDQDVSYTAKGVLIQILLMPPGLAHTEQDLLMLTKDKPGEIRSAFQELEAHGYLVRAEGSVEPGKSGDVIYTVYEAPAQSVPAAGHTQKSGR